MTELILSEITQMKWGHCVIGLERVGQGYCSIRPLPRFGNAWPSPFRHERGDRLQFYLSALPTERPHVEDRISSGTISAAGKVSKAELVNCLRQAEVAQELRELFGCEVHERRHRGNVCTKPGQGIRSICGCHFLNIRLQRLSNELRAALTLPSGEALRDLPVVDRDWNEFIELAVNRIVGANQLQRLNRFFNFHLRDKLLNDPDRFARIGLSRPFKERCWLMLDSLFPLPRVAWLENLPWRGSGA